MALLATNCVGTIASRCAGTKSVFGWPLYDAVRKDVNWVNSDPYVTDAYLRTLALVSIPLDVGLDTVLLPIDCLAGGLGFRRSPLETEDARPATSRD